MKQQFLLTIGGLLLLSSLLYFGKTVNPKEKTSESPVSNIPKFDINNFILSSKRKLNVNQANYIDNLENSVKRGDVKEQQIKNDEALAAFWKDSVKIPELYVFYTSEAAKLVNSEKNLTFAAQLNLEFVRNERDNAKRAWETGQAIELFESALKFNPNNDDLRIGLGSCYVFGKGMAGDAQETMKGIQQLLQVVRKDSTNMKAQTVLGIGGVISRQYPKAIDRLENVLKHQPNNVEAMSWLADAYAGNGDKANALKWYEISKRVVNDPQFSKEVDERINMLK